MKTLLAASAMLLAIGATSTVALADDGPRPSSENHWPGMVHGYGDPAGYAAARSGAPQAVPAAGPHYQWIEGYDQTGTWRGGWQLVQ